MQRYTYDEQLKAKRYMASVADSKARDAAISEYPDDYSLQKYVYENQTSSKRHPERSEEPRPASSTLVESANEKEESAPRRDGDAVPPWIRTLLDGEVYAARSRTAGSRALTTARMSALLVALDRRGGRLFEAALARELDVPAYRVRGLIAAARTVLNVDGVEILSADEATSAEERSVRLDRALLARQFGLEAENPTVA